MGANYVKGRVAKITEKRRTATWSCATRTSSTAAARRGRVRPGRAGGRRPAQPRRRAALFPDEALGLDEYPYVAETDEDLNPGQTSIPGVYVAGAASGAKDIADSILHAGAAVAQVAAHLEQRRLAMSEQADRRWRRERAAHRRLRLPLRRQHLRLRRRRPGRRGRSRTRPASSCAPDSMFACSDAQPGRHGRRHRGAAPRRPGRRLVLAQAPRRHLPRRRQAGRPEPVRVHAGEHPRAGLVGPHRRPGRGDATRPSAWSGPASPDPPDRPARADRRRDDPEDAGRRRRHRRPAGGHRAGRHRPRRLPRRARAGARRLGRPLRRDVPAPAGTAAS